MDWSVFHALNHSLAGHPTAQSAAKDFNSAAILVLVAAAVALWLLDRPGGSSRWKLVTAAAAASGTVGLLANVVLGSLWYQDRPFVDHPQATLLLVRHAPDNSFPSDHASVAFGIAFAVLLLAWRAGLVFLLGALAIGFDRMFVGVHYPSDIGTSFLVGLGAALLVTTLGRQPLRWVVRQVSRVTDPVLAPAWRRL